MSKTRQYGIWKAIKKRCYNKKDYAYSNYGSRGIEVCKKWLSFEGFWEDMCNGYEDNLTIDRINNNGNYCKENCRWATREEQSKNKRNNIFYVVDGKKMILREISKKYGIEYKKLKARIELLKMPIDKAISMGENKPKYYYKNNNGLFVVEVTKFGNRIFGGRHKREKDAKKAVKNIL